MTSSIAPPPSATLPESLAAIVKKFARVSDPKRGYELLIWFAQRLPELPADDRIAANKVQGCTSQVYVAAELVAGKVEFRGDSDSQLVKGMVGLLVKGLSGLSPAEVLAVSPDFIQQTKLNVSLTPSRANGFYSIFQLMQKKALELAAS